MNIRLVLLTLSLLPVQSLFSRALLPERPRIIISTDIGGTDPDDNQSLMHFLLYANVFDCEGILSTPSGGGGSCSEIFRMIDLYEKDLPRLRKHSKKYPSPEYLRSIVKQGSNEKTFRGYSEPSEASEWIIRCARGQYSNTAYSRFRPLYILVWGGLDDVAQALHDAPDIADKIRVYWIGGPNKKWGVNAFCYIAENFPELWMIENNSTYRGFIADYKNEDKWNAGFYNSFMKGAGFLGDDFYHYLQGKPKMGDTPSLLYMMCANPADPSRESWGGSFQHYGYSPRVVYNNQTSARDTAQIFSVIEWHVHGPKRNDIPVGKKCITLDIANQQWDGYYLGDGHYVVRYSTYKTGTQPYRIYSDIENFPEQNGFITIDRNYPGNHRDTDFKVGEKWFSDRNDPDSFWNSHQGAMTVYKWRKKVMKDWGMRCSWLKE